MEETQLMQLAFEEAAKGGSTWTNPKVGALIVKNGQILAQGHHEKFGGPHAEINMLNNLDNIKQAQGADMYVTLEPCSHFGKTPPCVQKVVEVGIKRVFIGEQDPNPIVSGNGIQYLKDHHVAVKVFNIQSKINEAYNFYYQNKRPLVTLKYAMTLDGKINQNQGQRSIISGKEAYRDSQKLRMNNQAILVGENTLKIDDPQLTVRLNKLDFPPLRVIVVRNADNIEPSMKLFQTSEPIYLLSEKETNKTFPDNVVVEVDHNWTPAKIVDFLATKNIESLLVEGGSSIQADFTDYDLVDKIVTYVNPTVFGGNSLPAISGHRQAKNLAFEHLKVTQLGNDLKLVARRKR